MQFNRAPEDKQLTGFRLHRAWHAALLLPCEEDMGCPPPLVAQDDN